MESTTNLHFYLKCCNIIGYEYSCVVFKDHPSISQTNKGHTDTTATGTIFILLTCGTYTNGAIKVFLAFLCMDASYVLGIWQK